MRALDTIGSALATFRNRIDDAVRERRLNIRTTGWHDVEVADSVPYSTFAYRGIERVIDRLELREDDVFIDIGCGKGRVTCMAALLPVRRVIGIDVDATLVTQARANADRMRGRRSPIEIALTSAEAFDYSQATALFLFNPFNFATLQRVIDAVRTSRQGAMQSRPLRIAYVNPRCESVIRESGRFERYEHWPGSPRGRLKFDVSFWRHAD